ncbi:MAG: type IV secretory system conjugative DNA transfer family protein [Flavobacteriales bacterium]|nr:type IV secretory system conjugative DNA transfer family protein [Flavobacteriales bacterium]MBS4042160.1 type IV secretory system conjugative DNA transfer family protein [Flavobacteriales bacterium]
MNTGENQEGLKKILDFTRLGSLVVLGIHTYLIAYSQLHSWALTHEWIDFLLAQIGKTGLFQGTVRIRILALGLLWISLLGAKGKKDPDLNWKRLVFWFLFWNLVFVFAEPGVRMMQWGKLVYLAGIGMAWMGVLTVGGKLSRVIRDGFSPEVFNHLNETFPQEQRLLENDYSVNLPTRFRVQKKVFSGWLNIINPFRATLVVGTPGAGKSYFVIRHIITQHLSKGFSMFVYDFKYDDLSRIAYNNLIKNRLSYSIFPKFYTINFDNLETSHRCNPLEPSSMTDITDASESSRTIMLGLNREWIKKQGDFFVESPINFVTAVIWFLKKYRSGKYCTLPHVIELMQVEYPKLFSVLRTEPEIEVLINPFVSAFLHGAAEQLEGQIASAKITMARLASPQLYYVLSQSEFTLDLNNPAEPKVICMGNNPQKQQVYGAVLSLYISRITKLVNRKNCLKSSLIFDEFPTIYFNGIDSLIATARSNKVATTLGVQDYSQLKKDYGREQAEVIMNTVGNIISGQVLGDTAKQISDRIGKINQVRRSLSINSGDTSISHSTQLELAVPPSTISQLSSGQFVGIVADDPTQKIELKSFHCEIQNDHKALALEEKGYQPIPQVRKLSGEEVLENYRWIKAEVRQLIEEELERMMDTPGLTGLMIK